MLVCFCTSGLEPARRCSHSHSIHVQVQVGAWQCTCACMRPCVSATTQLVRKRGKNADAPPLSPCKHMPTTKSLLASGSNMVHSRELPTIPQCLVGESSPPIAGRDSQSEHCDFTHATPRTLRPGSILSVVRSHVTMSAKISMIIGLYKLPDQIGGS